MNFISVFTGIGGFDLAFEGAGMTCIAQVEIDKNCGKILERHFPNTRRFTDVREFGKRSVGEAVDVICGGFPCQDLSVAGRREGLAGERSGLWFEFARVIDEFEPGWVVAENVPGLLSSNEGRDFDIILQWLAKRGYGVCWRIFDAQYFGVAQRRRRVFIVGSLGSGRSAEVLFESEGLSGNTPSRKEKGQGTAADASENVGIYQWASGGGDDIKDSAQSLRAGAEHSYQFVSGPIDIATSRNVKGDARLDFDTETFVVDARGNGDGQIVPNLTGDHSNRVTDYTPIVWDAQQETSVAHKTKLQSEKSYTLNGKLQMMVGVRRLTPTECERLQGFPDGYTANQADTIRYRQLGNAVAVPVVEWIGKRIAKMDIA